MAWFGEAAQPDLTLAQLHEKFAVRGVSVSIAPLWRFFARHGITRKSGIAHATEQDRPDILKRREQWFDGQLDLDPGRLVFIDEIWTATNMTRSHGRCRRRERLRMGYPHGHRKTTTFTAGLRRTGMTAPWVLDGSMNADAFLTYVTRVLVPELGHGEVIVMDNLSTSHKAPAMRASSAAHMR